MAMESPLLMKVLVTKSSINGWFSVAMFDYQRAILGSVYCIALVCTITSAQKMVDPQIKSVCWGVAVNTHTMVKVGSMGYGLLLGYICIWYG